jgi:hypothetical protein
MRLETNLPYQRHVFAYSPAHSLIPGSVPHGNQQPLETEPGQYRRVSYIPDHLPGFGTAGISFTAVFALANDDV